MRHKYNEQINNQNINNSEDKNKVLMNKPYNIQNTNICNDIFHISFFLKHY